MEHYGTLGPFLEHYMEHYGTLVMGSHNVPHNVQRLCHVCIRTKTCYREAHR